MKNHLIFLLLPTLLMAGCMQQSEKPVTLKTVPMADSVKSMLDSIIANSDSTYTKPYKRTDFVTATYYINSKSNTLCQVMKDSSQQIRQIICTKGSARSFFAQYYANGQLVAHLPLDTFGQYDGPAVYYYENGNKQMTGTYKDGLHVGVWTNYQQNGEPLSDDEYGNDGQKIKTVLR